MAGIRETDMPAHQAALVRETIQFLDRELREIIPERDPRIDSLIYLSPTEQLGLLRELATELARCCREFRAGDAVRRGSERTSWRPEPGTSSGGTAPGWKGRAWRDERLVARFSAGDGDREDEVRAALRAYRDLHSRGMLGDMTAEVYLRAHLGGR